MSTKGAGENLKKLRKKKGLSRKDAATALGLTPNSVYFWESNRSFPKPELWDDVIDLYNFDREELIRLAGGKDSPRVRRYLARKTVEQPEVQEKSERRGKRIYLRTKPKTTKSTKNPAGSNTAQLVDLTTLERRIAELEQQVTTLQESMKIVERAKELMQAWNRFNAALL